MRSVIFFTTGLLIGLAIHGADAQSPRAPMALNHVAISVPNLDEGIAFYTKALGLKEAFTFRDDRGTPLSYLQISRETFLELQPASADRPVGFLHIGLEVANLAGAVARSLEGTDESLASINAGRLLNLDVFVAFTLLGLLALVPMLVKAWHSRSSRFRSKHN